MFNLWLKYGVPFVPLHLHIKGKMNIFGASNSKWSLDFKIELQFGNRTPISKWSFNLEIEHRFQKQTSILKWSFHLKIGLRFQNDTLISKWSFDFEIELRFQNQSVYWKYNSFFDLKTKRILKCFHFSFFNFITKIEKERIFWN